MVGIGMVIAKVKKIKMCFIFLYLKYSYRPSTIE